MLSGKIKYYNIDLKLGIVSIDGTKNTALIRRLDFDAKIGDEVRFALARVNAFQFNAINVYKN